MESESCGHRRELLDRSCGLDHTNGATFRQGGSQGIRTLLSSHPLSSCCCLQVAEPSEKTKEPTDVVRVPTEKGGEWICRDSERM